MANISLAVYDYQRKKICDVYDSSAQSVGQAHDIFLTEEQTGWKELSFTLPRVIDGEQNFRWQYIRNDYLLRLRIGNYTDWFILQTPKKTKNGLAVTDTVKCGHISALLKTKNLYLVLDDTNGIGTIRQLAGVILQKTGWSQGECDTFYERDGTTEKIRSISSENKRGAYQLIQDVCDLFNAYPIFHGDTKTVDFRYLQNKKPIRELSVGLNIDGLTVESDTTNLVTRLYVEGEYGENGYVGIDSVNPTGLNFLLDFDYYKENGLFTQTHQDALDEYLEDMPVANQAIKSKMAEILLSEDQLNQLWGQINYVVYQVNNGTITKTITGGTVTEEQRAISEGDKLYTWGNYTTYVSQPGYYNVSTGKLDYIESTGHATWTAHTQFLSAQYVQSISGRVYMDSYGYALAAFDDNMNLLPAHSIVGTDGTNTVISNWTFPEGVKYIALSGWVSSPTAEAISVTVRSPGEYHIIEAGSGGSVDWGSGEQLAVKFLTLPSGNIGARQVAVESKQMMITKLLSEYEMATSDEKKQMILQQIAAYQVSINQIYNGTAEATGLYEAMWVAVELAVEIDSEYAQLTELQTQQSEIEEAFAGVMGDLLKDGYWSNTNYAPGQEDWLYYDALERMEQVAKPSMKYSITYVAPVDADGEMEHVPELNTEIKLIESDFPVKDIVYIAKRTVCLDIPNKDTAEISNDKIISLDVTFETIFGQVTQLSDLVNQRSAIYERAKVINENGTLPVDKVFGEVNIAQTNLQSPTSNWYTDNNTGSLVFESVLGDSAYQISGDGIMIADSKDADGNWEWKIIGSGEGLSADSLTGGFLPTDRIENGTISTPKLAADISITTTGNITMNGGNITLNSDSNFIANAGGSIQMFSNDESNSYIIFGGTRENPNFSLGTGGQIKAKQIFADTISVKDMNIASTMSGSLGNLFIVSETQPESGKGIIWIQPSSVTTLTYNSTMPHNIYFNGYGVVSNETDPLYFVRNGSNPLGGQVKYGIAFRIYNWSGSCYVSNLVVSIKGTETGTDSWLPIYSDATRRYIGDGDYLTVDTTEILSSALANYTSNSSIAMKVEFNKDVGTQMRFERETCTLKCMSSSASGTSACNVFYVP